MMEKCLHCDNVIVGACVCDLYEENTRLRDVMNAAIDCNDYSLAVAILSAGLSARHEKSD